MTSNIPSGTGRPYASAIELTPDVWIMIMGYLSTSDLVIVGKVSSFICNFEDCLMRDAHRS